MSNQHDNWFTTDPKEQNSKEKKQKAKRPNVSRSKKEGVFSKVKLKMLSGFEFLGRKAKDKPLMKKILFTVVLIAIFRVMASITVPGVIVNKDFAKDSGSFVGIMNTLGGGTLAKFSIAALGISPYITASIIVTLLKSGAIPAVERMANSGPKGKRKMNVITRVITLILAIPMSITLIQQFTSNSIGMVSLIPSFDHPLYKFFLIPVIMIAGSMFTLFLGEQITEKGVGNGTSLIIFSGIAARMPSMFQNAWTEIVGSASSESIFIGVINFVVYVVVFLILIFIITYVYKAERQVPIQNTGSGMTMDKKQMSRLPIKLNPGGVMPVIFAMMIVTLPLQIAQFLNRHNESRIWIEHNMRLTAPVGLSIMIVLIFLFTMLMSFSTFNTIKIAENFKKQGTFIPGIRPGDETEKYLTGIIIRLSIFSGFYLSAITAIKYVEQIMGLSSAITFGGTTVIILVSVAIETINQLKARDKTHKISKAKIKSNESKGNKVGGLLW